MATSVEAVAERLAAVPGVAAVVLGGSRASGLASEHSDTDLGLYYLDAEPIDVDALRASVHELDPARPAVTGLYEWGPWVNGGAWANVDGVGAVDLVYRSVDDVAATVDALERGDRDHHWNQQPPFGFTSVIHAGEVHRCRPFHDRLGLIAALKGRVSTYPDALRRRVVGDDLWLAAFSIRQARTPAFRNDVHTTIGCLTRTDHYLVQVLYALNRTWFVSDKIAWREIETFTCRPSDYGEAMGAALAGAVGLVERVEYVAELHAEVAALAGDLYRPRW